LRHQIEIEDTYSEAFEGLFTRILVTAKDLKRLSKAVNSATSLPSVVINRTEGGIEKWLVENETPDGRIGALLQFWGILNRNDVDRSVERFYKELSYRIRQGILVTPTTSIFNAWDSGTVIDMMERVGHCGDGYEHMTTYKGREMIVIPLMMGDFLIERFLGYGEGVMGGNIWILCEDENSALEAGDRVIDALSIMEGVITPFDICSAGSKPETNFPEIGPTTNHPYCPTLRGTIPDFKVPEGVNSIPEIVINAVSLDVVKSAMRVAIDNAVKVEGVMKISAGNYGGKLGKYKVYLKEIYP
jgi:formylmethanofuran--tetrahydromethanopterin N-formyltransferase